MDTPSNFELEIKLLKKRIADRLNEASNQIVKEECAKILGRVKVVTYQHLGNPNYEWYIESKATEKSEK